MSSLSLIGPGRHGTAIAALFASHGVDVTLFHYRPQKAEAAARAVRAAACRRDRHGRRQPGGRRDAAEVVALTTLWDAPQRAVLSQIGSRLVGKVLLDVSNPLDVTPSRDQLPHPGSGIRGTVRRDPAARRRRTREGILEHGDRCPQLRPRTRPPAPSSRTSPTPRPRRSASARCWMRPDGRPGMSATSTGRRTSRSAVATTRWPAALAAPCSTRTSSPGSSARRWPWRADR